MSGRPRWFACFSSYSAWLVMRIDIWICVPSRVALAINNKAHVLLKTLCLWKWTKYEGLGVKEQMEKSDQSRFVASRIHILNGLVMCWVMLPVMLGLLDGSLSITHTRSLAQLLFSGVYFGATPPNSCRHIIIHHYIFHEYRAFIPSLPPRYDDLMMTNAGWCWHYSSFGGYRKR